MSIFQQGLDMFKGAAKALKDIEDEPIPEDIQEDFSSKPEGKKNALEEIKAQAREKAAKDMQSKDNTQTLLENFKRFLSREKRNKMIMLCEREDGGKVGYISMMAFSRVLKNMGFRLLFDQVKLLITTLSVYDENRDKVLYSKIIGSAFRKLYKRDPYVVPPKPSKLQAVVLVQRFLRNKKENKIKKLQEKKSAITPNDILNGLAQKIQNSGQPLIKVFERIDKDHSGFIEIEELNVLFQEYGVELNQDHLYAVFKAIDGEGLGKINYRNLLKAVETYKPTGADILSAIAVSSEEKEKIVQNLVLSIKALLKDLKMAPNEVFRMFDKENKGKINTESFISTVSRITSGYSQFQIRQVFNYIDTSRDGEISLTEFSRVFFDIKETPTEMLKRIEIEEKQRIEQEFRKKLEEDYKAMKSAPPSAPVQAVVDDKPTIQDAIKQKQMELEAEERNEARRKLDPMFAMLQDQKKKEAEAEEKKKKEAEEKKKADEEKKKAEEEKKKKDLESKGKIGKALQGIFKPKPEEKKTPGRQSASVTRSNRSGLKKQSTKPTLQEKASKALAAPSENQLVLKIQNKELYDMIKKEFISPLIEKAKIHGDSILLARQTQKQFESRAVIKHVYKWGRDWSQEVVNPMPRTLWISGEIGRVGYIDDQGYLNQIDILSGSCFPVLHLGTKPPFQRTPLLAGTCDSNIGRLYLLNKQWTIEVWELHQQTTAPRKRIKVLSKIIGDDYVEKFYKNRHRNVFPKLLTLSATGKIIVNASCVDGFIYCFEPISLTLVWRLRLTLKELAIPEPVLKAFEEFSYFVRECNKIGITESKVFELLDRNSDGKLSFEEFSKAVKDNKMPITDNQIRAMFKAMDADQTGTISIDEFWGGIHMRGQEILKREQEDKQLIEVPQWVTNINANERAKECMYKLHRAIETKSLTPLSLFQQIDTDKSGSISRSEFSKGIKLLLSPLITDSDIELLLLIADRDNSGLINYKEFSQFLSLKKLSPALSKQLNSSDLPRDSIKYVIHKCLELGIDFYKICREQDVANTGTLPKEIMSSILLCLPVGLNARQLKVIADRDLMYAASGYIDYQEIFEREEYIKLLRSAKRPGIEFEMPAVQEEAAIVEDFEFIEELDLVAFSTINPVSSVIYLKHLNGNLIAKLIGHFGDCPPVLRYVKNANTLVSGERREGRNAVLPALPPCQIVIWNLQRDLINKFQLSPPWTIKPYLKEYAHEGGILDITYLPLTQLLATCGSDGYIKLWSPTGTPYSLTETHNLPIAASKPGVYVPLKPQFTSSNAPFTCIGAITNPDTQSFRLIGSAFESNEWLISLQLTPSSSKNISGCIMSYGFKRLNISVPAKQHDWEIPATIHSSLIDMFKRYRTKDLSEYRAGLSSRLEKVMNNAKVSKAFEKEIKISVIRSIIFECNYENAFKIAVILPDRIKKGRLGCEELYNILVAYAGFGSLPYLEYMKILEGISEKIAKEPAQELKPKIGLLTVLKMIEDKNKPKVVNVSPVKTTTSLITSIKADKQNHELLFESPLQSLEQELFEYLSIRLMEQKISVGQLFQEIDTDQSGLINLTEFSHFLQKIGFSLRKNEVKSIMKCVDFNSDESISYKELIVKLKAFGYSEEWKPAVYTHTWEDSSIIHFFKTFIEKNQFRDIIEYFEAFDYNKDGSLTIHELRNALGSVDRPGAERILNILLVFSKGKLGIQELAKALADIEKELPKASKLTPDYPAMEVCIKDFNAFMTLKTCVEDLGTYCLAQDLKVKRGFELISKQYRLTEGLQLLASGLIRYQELVDYILANSILRIYQECQKSLVCAEFNMLANTFPLDLLIPRKLEPSDFKVTWESEVVISESINFYKGTILPDLEEVSVYVYSPEGLKHVSRDGSSLYSHLQKELSIHSALQEKSRNIVKFLGFHEKYLGLDKTLLAVFERSKGISLQDLIRNNGGLLKIPLLYNTKVSIYLFKYWGRKILNVLYTLQTYSLALRYLSPENIFLVDNGEEVLVESLRGIGCIDNSGKITSAPDISLFIKGSIKDDPYVAPEFYFSNVQTAAADVWGFGTMMFSLMFGEPPASFLKSYQDWMDKKYCKTRIFEENVSPACSFPFNIFQGYEIQNGKATSSLSPELYLIKSVKAGSFSGMVKDNPNKSELDEIEELYKTLKDVKNTKAAASTDLGRALDAIFLCLQVDAARRPTIKALLNSPAFTLDKYEEKQAKSFSALIFTHKNPEIVITQQISNPLQAIKSSDSSEFAEEIINLIETLGSALLNFEDSIMQDTFQAISATNLSTKEKDILIKKHLNSPLTELANQCIKDNVFEDFCYVALNYFHLGEDRVVLAYANLLKYLLIHLNSEESGLSGLVSVLIETLLKLFIGEDTCLASKAIEKNYVLKESFWNPYLYEIMAPIYRQSISESGNGQYNCPVIKDYLTKNRHSDYFSELMMIAENFNLILKPESSTVAKRNALRHLKSMLQTKNDHKTLAALDFKLPQIVIRCLQDSDYKVRSESIEIFHLISEGCKEPVLPKLPGVNKQYRSLGIINFFSIAKSETHESTKNFEKFTSTRDSTPLSIKEIAKCFENPMFVIPIVRLIKLKSEPYDTKECSVRILVNILQGSELCQLAALSPVTDSISSLCKCLVVSSRTVDKKSGKSLGPLLKDLLGNLLENARSYILSAFRNTPGAEALLKEQSLIIPDKVTIECIYSLMPKSLSTDNNIQALVQALKNWLVHERTSQVLNPKEQSMVSENFKFLKESVDFYWKFCEIKPSETEFFVKPAGLLKASKEKIKLILLFFEWMLFMDLDFGWFKVDANVKWLIDITTLAIQSSRSDFEVFSLEEEGIIMQRTLCRLLVKEKANVLLAKLKFGSIFAEQLAIQYDRLGKVISKHTEPLHILQFYPVNSEVRLATFMNLIQFNNLQAQFLDSDFIGVLISDFLNDSRVLSARFNKLNLEFLPFRETPPVRSEAINIIITILKEKTKCKLMYDDLLLHLQRCKAVQTEIRNCLSSNPVIQSTAFELLQAFVASEDSQLEYLLMQGNAKETFKELLESCSDLGLRFPVIKAYTNR